MSSFTPKRTMRVFAPRKIENIRKATEMSFGDFMRKMILIAPAYGVKPSNNHVHDVISGQRSPRPNYLALFADTLGVTVDEFFEKRRVEI